MKKRILGILLIATLSISIFVGCSSSMDLTTDDSKAEIGYDNGYYDVEDDVVTEDSSIAGSSGGLGSAEFGRDTVTSTSPSESLSEKMIYSAEIEMESLEFDKSIEDVYSMMDAYGAFIESSSVTGTDYNTKYYALTSYRNASFVIRVPKDNFQEMVSSFSEIGNVTYNNTWSDNITAQYTDVESRLAAYRIEEEQLLEMLDQCTTVEDMITVQSRLSEVRYSIESLTSQLKNWDNEVNYSTINLYITEVKELSDEVSATKPYWEDVGDSFLSTLKGVGSFFKGLFKFLIAALPVLVILAVIAVIVILIVRASIKHSAAKKAKKAQQVSVNSVVPPAQSSSFKSTDDKKE